MSEVTELPSDASELYVRVLRACADALVQNDVDAAREALRSIAGQRWMLKLTPRPSAVRLPPGTARRPRPAIPETVVAQMFRRDEWRCRACHGLAMPRRVLGAISDVFPDEIPYDMRYTTGLMHPAYWALVAEADHRVPHSLGGSNELDNLDTMHAMCNTVKSDSEAEDRPRPVVLETVRWGGLVDAYPAIVEVGDRVGSRHSRSTKYHRDLLRAFGFDADDEGRPHTQRPFP